MIDFFKEKDDFNKELNKIFNIDTSKVFFGEAEIADLQSDQIKYRNPIKNLETMINFTSSPQVYTVYEIYRLSRIAYNEDKKRRLYNELYAKEAEKIISDIKQFDTIYKNIGLSTSTIESICEWIELYDEPYQRPFELETFLKTSLVSLKELRINDQKLQSAKLHFPFQILFPKDYKNFKTDYDSIIGTISDFIPLVIQAKDLRKKEKNKNEQGKKLQTGKDSGSTDLENGELIWSSKGKREPFESLYTEEKPSTESQNHLSQLKNLEKIINDISSDIISNIQYDNMSSLNIPIYTNKSTTKEIAEQYNNVTNEQIALNAAIAAFNVSGITVPFLNISTSFEDSDKKASFFGETLMDIADIAGKIGGAFMNVDEKIGKAIGSAGGLAASISKIYSAVSADPLEGIDTKVMTPEQIEEAKKKGEKQNGLAIMAGIQGAFAGLQGLFGGESGSDTSELLGGLGGLGAVELLAYMP